ncbi:hydrogen peroxide-inducible genes activator [Acidocella aminolytica]|jgi:LysR family hydrogen peroxide-inducible transcriptional activator|uniref:Transcriptional regulator LysR/OxyR n=1 Tax=Acidocella aminolytica 101 = DSM 11237 TaxID=1120923 RepID=A0A0D6PEI9_9PROT|nr:hydrogen peroxide-inducible genes activator [Acidocella aminolytica]GAN79279.1 transcriptional regulator LysR/OxyR [Acidocella aminolytica 101 = DSM 11237]SHE37456.1 LysR family transcriptional regulator, hydrogen peroxide-inducible genes activator [Acidocella aminolytica 101 = DSM 11237]
MAYLPTPQQLRYLVMLAETGHFGRAASACAVSQSTLSAGILALERALDAQILDRAAAKHPVFTPLGLELVAKARSALSALSDVAETADAARAPMSGPLRLGIIPTIGPFLLPRLMPALRERYKALRLFLREDQTERLLDQLDAGQLDILILAHPCACGEAEVLNVARDDFLVALPPGHVLASREAIPLADLASEQFLLLEDGHCLRDQVLSVCGTSLAREREQRFAATSLHTLIQMVAGGLGVTLVPRLAVDAGLAAGTDVEIRRLEGAEGWRSLGLAWRAGSPRSGEYRTLAPLVAEACSQNGIGPD